MRLSILFFAFVITSLAACKTTPVAPAAEEPTFLYSPYVVNVDGRSPYDRVSFKDVGMSLPDQDRSLNYEMLAEELAQSLASVPDVGAQMGYDERLLDPHNHLSCGRTHVYVDVWQGEDTWGYSLWSGCGEDNQFARAEVPFSDPAHPKFEALSQHIAAALETAHETNCFTRHC